MLLRRRRLSKLTPLCGSRRERERERLIDDLSGNKRTRKQNLVPRAKKKPVMTQKNSGIKSKSCIHQERKSSASQKHKNECTDPQETTLPRPRREAKREHEEPERTLLRKGSSSNGEGRGGTEQEDDLLHNSSSF
jgi:hypothetical protein